MPDATLAAADACAFLVWKIHDWAVIVTGYPRHDTYVRPAQSAIMKSCNAGFLAVFDQRDLTVQRVLDPFGPFEQMLPQTDLEPSVADGIPGHCSKPDNTQLLPDQKAG